ncbi:MAG TPA: PfkB family carbohydrate kinase [Chloroflexota bacterium]|nr:PfkB family carbohydrate kinase [Chloroflexota bacterium]
MIVCLGDIFVDVLVQRPVDAATTVTLASGGSAANTAAWLAWLGAPVGLVAAVGADMAGDLLTERLRRRGVRDAVTRVAHLATGVMIMEVLSGRPGPPTVDRGANDSLRLDAPQLALLGEARWLHCTAYAFLGEDSQGSVRDAAAIAREAGAMISLDLGAAHLAHHLGLDHYQTLIRQLGPDLLLANEEEAALLAQPGETPLAALARFAPMAILKRGQDGCEVIRGETEWRYPATPATVVDPLGAGDAFAAGVLHGLCRQETVAEAVARGQALGARCVGLLGGQPPPKEDQGIGGGS